MGEYERARSDLRDQGIKVIAASTDKRADAEDTVERLGLSFPVGYELPMLETARRFGAYYEQRRSILHATGFVVRPAGTIAVACYSSGPVGRLAVANVIKLVAFYKSKGQ